MKILYIDAENSGISGDMFLAGLLGLLSNPKEVIFELNSLKNYLPGVTKLEISLKRIKQHELLVNQLDIDLKENKDHRSAKSLKEALNHFLEDNKYTEPSKTFARRVLQSLIQAEMEVHGELSDNIHLHELSSIDTLIDILGVTKALLNLGFFEKEFMVSCSKIPLGGGTIKGAHGLLPIPAPATLKILEKSNFKLYKGPIETELVTPTGAALLLNINPKTNSHGFILDKSAFSTGQKKFKDFLNVLRLYFGTFEDNISRVNKDKNGLFDYSEKVTVLETAVDDASGEIIGNLVKLLEREEILDVQIIPSLTKKNRPSNIVKVLCNPAQKYKIMELMFENISTLGIRYCTIDRICVERIILCRNIVINSNKYNISYKLSYIDTDLGRKIVNVKAEYEDLRKISSDTGMSLKEVQIHAQSSILNLLNEFKKTNKEKLKKK
ncbi:MAG: nickel pincer cofactor biosynthesis protein LarC [Promethearchaeota archaeon]